MARENLLEVLRSEPRRSGHSARRPRELRRGAAALVVGVVLGGMGLFAATAAAAEESGTEGTAEPPPMAELFAPYAALLEDHLLERELPGGGLVSAFRYGEALADPCTAERLASQDRRLRRFDPRRIDTKEYAIAFWLNAYNYFMIAHILENPEPDGDFVESVRDYGYFFDPYRVFGRELFEVGGRRYSLDEIEKGILLGREYAERGWKEARVHFAVNCASVGCPPLRRQIYTPANVDAMLTENTRRALRTPRHLHVEDGTLHLTQLFEWYEADYLEEADSVRDWIARYTDPERRERIRRTTETEFIDYDWALNEPRNFPELDGDRARDGA